MSSADPDPDAKPMRGRPRTLDADAVLGVAVDAYWRDDPAEVSVNAICRLAGVSKPSVYRAFGGEDGLMRAALDAYAERELSQVFAVLGRGAGLRETLEAMIDYACADPRMEAGCLFHKMRAGRRRLGPETLAGVEGLERDARAAFAAFLEARREAGDPPGAASSEIGARYLLEQLGLAVTQRAGGEDPERIRETLTLALSVLSPGIGGRAG